MLQRLIRYSCIYAQCMSPALNRSSALQHFKIRNPSTFDFYLDCHTWTIVQLLRNRWAIIFILSQEVVEMMFHINYAVYSVNYLVFICTPKTTRLNHIESLIKVFSNQPLSPIPDCCVITTQACSLWRHSVAIDTAPTDCTLQWSFPMPNQWGWMLSLSLFL